jgi:glycosyltransferase involved in cell wall biosynthesis
MPRILHIIDHNGLGGAQRVISGILQHRQSDLVYPLRLHVATLLSPPPDYPFQVGLQRLPSWLRNSRCLVAINLLLLAGWLKKHPVDIIHCHLIGGWITGLWLHATLRPSIRPKFLFHEHNPYLQFSKIYPALVKLVAKAGKVIFVSQHYARLAMDIGLPKNRTIYLPNYVHPDFFSCNTEKSQNSPHTNTPSQPFIVGYAGRLVGIKGWGSLLEVASKLIKQPVQFRIAGIGPDETRLKNTILALNLTHSVQLVGFVSDMRQFYASINCLFVPSTFEIFGLVPLEAQACDVPVIAFDIPGINEVIGAPNAILVPPGNIDAVVESIVSLMGNPELHQQIVEDGRQNARLFSIQTYLASLDVVYHQTCQDTSS